MLILLTACSAAQATAEVDAITVQYTSAAAPYLPDLYACAGQNAISAVLRAADFQDLQSIDLAMRIGQPANLATQTYQIGTEDILVITNRQNPISSLSEEQVRGLFTGQIQTWKDISGADTQVQVWVFPSGEDVQQIFEQAALGGTPVTTSARLANTPDEMSQAVAGDVNAIGVLTRHWKAGNVSSVYTAASVPVLAIAPALPDATLAGIIACLQK